MASYRIEFKRSAERDIRRIDRALIPRILNAVEVLSDNPFPRQSAKLSGAERT
jgi:mRNA interferase RelE/StbE